MATYDSLAALFTATANAIRDKLGVSSTFKATDFPAKIASIPTGVQLSVEKTLTVTRHDASSAPADAQLFVKYCFVNENDTWGTKIEELQNDGSVVIPVPSMDYVSSSKIQNEDLFFVFFIMPTPSAKSGVSFYSDSRTTSGLIGTRVNIGDTTSTSEQAGYVTVHTDMSELSDGTATLGVYIRGG